MVLLHFQTFTISGFVLIPIHGSIHALQILRITRVLCSTLKGGVPKIWGGGSAGELLAHRRADRLPSSSAAHTWKRLDDRAPVWGGGESAARRRVAHLPSFPAATGLSNYSILQQLIFHQSYAAHVTSTAVQEKSYYEVWPFITYVSAASLRGERSCAEPLPP